MTGPKPTRLWHHLCREHFWWLVNERIYARCPPTNFKIPDHCQKKCLPHNQFHKYDQLRIAMLTLAGTAALCYAFGHIDYNKYASLFVSDDSDKVIQKNKVIKKIPCDQREPEPLQPCVCDEPEKPKNSKKAKKPPKPDC